MRVDSTVYYLKEFEYRMAYALFGTALFFLISYNYKQELIFLFLPKGLSYFISGDLTEVFLTYIDICTYFTIVVGLNIAALQTFSFLRPAMYNGESYTINNRFWWSLLFYSIIFSLLSPYASQVFWDAFSCLCIAFLPANSTLEPKINNYIRHVQGLNELLIFTLPILVVVKLVQRFTTPESWVKYRGLVYVISTLFGALVTPPDLSSQLMIAIPLISFYESQIFYWQLRREYEKVLHERGLL
uniref:TatC n=1 Tax=Phaeophyceae sp. TaxID=2249243 RepID=A0A8E8PDN8_9PHAE|nr:TatC [Phaeophyceae sp.]